MPRQPFPVFSQCKQCGDHVAFLQRVNSREVAVVNLRPINPDEASCVLCGCTEERACPRGCFWLDDGGDPDLELCSACLTFDEARHAPHRCAK